MHDLGRVIDWSKWPSEIPRPKKKGKMCDQGEKADDSDNPLADEDIEELELDDQHAQFLNVADLQEEDEVEKLVGKVAECCEGLSVDFSNTQDDIMILFE